MRAQQKEYRKEHNLLVLKLGLSRKPASRDAFLANLESASPVKLLDNPFPPPNTWVSLSESITSLWQTHLATIRLNDKRHTRRAILTCTNLDQWQKIITENESCIVRNETGELVCIVIRNFIDDETTCAWADGIIAAAIDRKKSVRLDDPGKLVLEGYSAGALSQPSFAWTQNLLSTKYTPNQLAELKYQSASVFALFWNVSRRILPPAVIDDYNKYLEENLMCRMNSVTKKPDTVGSYSIGQHTFNSCELAPPSGHFAKNYIRYTHNEYNATKYMIAWTTNRSTTKGKEAGGHFYIADYGILIEGSSNSLVVWEPGKYHGTTLTAIDPMDLNPDFVQSGVSIALSNRLAKAWKLSCQQELTIEEEKMALENDSDGEEK